MKIVGPPPIANLDGIIDILTNPEKYAKYLQELKQLKDTIKGLCEIYDTKEQANTYLNKATMAWQETEDRIKQADGRLVAERAKWEAEQDEAKATLQALNATLAQREQAAREGDRALAVREQAVLQAERSVTEREAKHAAAVNALATRAAALDAQEERIKKATETLTSLGM